MWTATDRDQPNPPAPRSGRNASRGATAFLLCALATFLLPPPAFPDEGMWLFNAPPRQVLQERYQFEPTAAWLEHLQKAAVRFNSGGSGSFVSEDGLILSNHHVGADALQKFSDAEHDYLRDGFYAPTREAEKRALDLELNVLMSIEDVTARVNAAVPAGATAEAAFAARRAVLAEIEKESFDQTGLRSDVVTLFQGGRYHLYRYKRYTDVRLVFAPEQAIAFFGGDPDNFEYPRYDLDICLFRAYEDGKPARVPHYLKWSPRGVRDGELVLVAGHPGHTSRDLTLDELAYLRDVQFPRLLSRLYDLEVTLTTYSQRSAENARRAKDMLFGVQNSRKARRGGLDGLRDPAIMAEKRTREQHWRERFAADPQWREALAAYDRIAQAQAAMASNAVAYALLEGGQGFTSTLFPIARTLFRWPHEKAKPNGQRLSEFRDSHLPSLELELFSAEPIYPDFERVQLADGLGSLVGQLGFTNALVQRILAGQSPSASAAEWVRSTQLTNVGWRRKLFAATPAEVAESKDPLLQLAALIDPEARRLRDLMETQDEVKRQAHGRLAAGRLALEGASIYPDATFTLRLAFGQVKGYTELGRPIPFQTTFAGLYQRAAEHPNEAPFELPRRWRERQNRLNPETPLNFVSTPDIVGGNSGSPVVNRNGEFVGIIFDGNLQSLVLDFIYTEEEARALSVNAQAIIEALRVVYDAPALANELLSGRLGP